jgi:hypothetical protein
VAAGELPVQPSQPPLRPVQRSRVGDHLASGQHRQVADADVDADHAGHTSTVGNAPLDLYRERHEPAARGAGDRGGQDAGGALFEAAGELAGGLVGAEPSDPGQDHVVPVGLDADGAGGESAGRAGAVLGLEVREADTAPLAPANL